MKKTVLETGVGIFVIIGLICVGYLTVKLGKMELLIFFRALFVTFG
jgi:phospholipid/cholesterol/gamma-HCH transport system substrate-binding protein